jgi:hypothetical protein
MPEARHRPGQMARSAGSAARRCGIEDMRPVNGSTDWALERCGFDFAAPITTENPQRGLGGGRRELAYVRSRHAANVAFGR